MNKLLTGAILVFVLAASCGTLGGMTPQGWSGTPKKGAEGSVAAPLILAIEEPVEGRVAPGTASYYAVTVKRQCDIVIEVSGAPPEAELEYYGPDSTFSSWQSAASGSLDVQDYLVPPGTSVYFAVRCPEGGRGGNYLITVTPSYLIDPVGVRIKGEIYDLAEEVPAGSRLDLVLSEAGLDYYVTRCPAGGSLGIRASGLPDPVEVTFFDVTDSEYGSAGMEREGGKELVLVDGLSAGASLWWYVSGDSEAEGARTSFVVEVTAGD